MGDRLVEKVLLDTPAAEPPRASTSGGSASAIVIGGGFQGLLNHFRVIDWNSPLLTVLPNGKTHINVTIGAK